MIMAKVQKEMSGDKSPLTKADIAAAKAEFKKNAKKSTTESEDPRKQAEGGLPPGVKLLDVSVAEKEFGVTTNMKFAVRQTGKPRRREAQRIERRRSRRRSNEEVGHRLPVQGLEIAETSSTITIHTKPQNPAEKVKAEAGEAGPKLDAETEKMMNDAFKNMRIAWKITAPFEVVSSNATRKEGKTLIWEYDWDKLQKLAASPKALDLGVNVTYKK